MPSERPWTPRETFTDAIIRVLRKEGSDVMSWNEMGQKIDEESGYSELYEALERIERISTGEDQVACDDVEGLQCVGEIARAALAKANPKEEKQNG